MPDTLEQLVARLCRRDEARTEATVQADVRQLLLTAPFNLDEALVRRVEEKLRESDPERVERLMGGLR